MTIRKQVFLHYKDSPMLEMIPSIYKAAPELEEAGSTGGDPANQRASHVSWITSDKEENHEIFKNLFDITQQANNDAEWYFDVGIVEPLQYTSYGPGERYDWHVDQHIHNDAKEEFCRKISFSLLLNDDFEGGELQLECGSPVQEERHQTVKLAKGDIIFFPSFHWHRVLPVTSGERHSLVGWVCGPNWR